MGQFIKCVVITKVIVEAKTRSSKEISLDEIKKGLEKELDTKHYSFEQKDEKIIAKINSGFYVKEIVRTMKYVSTFYDDDYEVEDNIKKVKKAGVFEKMMELANYKIGERYQITNEYRTVSVNNNETAHCDYEGVILFMNGKAMLECYGSLFKFMENLLRQNKEEYPMLGVMKFLI